MLDGRSVKVGGDEFSFVKASSFESAVDVAMFAIDLEPGLKESYIERYGCWDPSLYKKKIEKVVKLAMPCLIIHQSNMTVGTVTLFVNQHDALVFALYLFPEWQNRGIGTAIIKECINIANQIERDLYFSTFTENKRSLHVGKKLGFVIFDSDNVSKQTYLVREVSKDN